MGNVTWGGAGVAVRGLAVHGLAVLGIAAAVLAACSGSDGATDDPPASPATRFVIDRVPDGFVPIVVGEGTARQEWGSDLEGTDEPFVVLSDGDRRVVVNAFGYEHTQGGFGQRRGSYRGWHSTARDLGDDLGLRADSREVSGDELAELLDHVEPADDRLDAPVPSDLPGGWSVVGASGAEISMSAISYLQPTSNDVPGPVGSYGAGWAEPDRATASTELTAVSLDGDAAQIEAWTGLLRHPVMWYGDAHGEAVTVDGRDAAFVLLTESEGGTVHLLLSRMADGSLLLLSSWGDEMLTKEQLVDVAESARPATEQEWTALSDSTWGGPELHPDHGAIELARGTEQGQEWLLQATPTPRIDPWLSGTPRIPADPNAGWFLDPCLKLIGGRRACTEGASFLLRYVPGGARGVADSGFSSEFTLAVTSTPGTTVRIAGRGRTVTAPLHELPEGSTSVAVFMGPLPGGFDGCSGSSTPPTFPDDAGFEIVYIDVLDATGAFTGCANPTPPPG